VDTGWTDRVRKGIPNRWCSCTKGARTVSYSYPNYFQYDITIYHLDRCVYYQGISIEMCFENSQAWRRFFYHSIRSEMDAALCSARFASPLFGLYATIPRSVYAPSQDDFIGLCGYDAEVTSYFTSGLIELGADNGCRKPKMMTGSVYRADLRRWLYVVCSRHRLLYGPLSVSLIILRMAVCPSVCSDQAATHAGNGD